MTHSEEEAIALNLLNTIRHTYQNVPEEALACLKQIKHLLIGHDQAKHLYVDNNIIQILVRILELEHAPKELKLEAGVCIGSLSYGMVTLRRPISFAANEFDYRRRVLCIKVTTRRCAWAAHRFPQSLDITTQTRS